MIELAEYTEKVKKYVRKDTLREAADILEREARIQEERSEAYIAITLRELAQAILNLENNK